MKVAISATGPTLDAEVDPRFGRCKHLLFVDLDSMDFEAIDNPGISSGGGAGIAATQTVVDKGAQAVLTGNMGPNAFEVLSQAGIEIITGVAGKIRDALEAFKKGGFKATAGPTVKAHSGIGAAPPPGSEPSASRGGLDALKAEVQGMRQQLDDVLRRLDVLEKKS